MRVPAAKSSGDWFAPIRETPYGMVDASSDAKRQGWLDRMRDYGRRLV